ncbi:hypothetical protein GGP41_010553 [Bipolaris sorokiniana]|uniref:Maltose/galactoside acetyltransferase domain-containing protein n=1 Tax=Cochliobolus sativus TaxID=45130 RepID=A0A8H6DY74_COCSA|nr:hypothetical protein GGP41_010553 [Bipolaris sorokiniana]
MAAQEKNMQEIEKAKKLNHVPWGEEYEKMISGMLYGSWTRDLTAARFKARAFAHKYNTWFPPPSTDPATGFDVLAAERVKMLKEILGHVGDDEICKLEPLPFIPM